MFTTVKQFFQTKSATQTVNKNSNSNFLTDASAINGLLKELQAALLPCSLYINNSTQAFQSELLAINTTNNTISLDELRPLDGNAILKSCKSVKVVFLYRGLDVSFTLNRPLNYADSQNRHQFTLPNRVYYPKKKAASAVLDVQAMKIAFEGFSNSSKLLVVGHVCDLSESGISANLSKIKVAVEKGELLKKCFIILPETKKVITFDLVLDIVNLPSASNGKTFISGHFENMNNKDEENYEQFMRKLEQNELKKRLGK